MTSWVHRLMFDPPWWGIFLNPAFLPRRALARAMREHGTKLQGRVLDVGCGLRPLSELPLPLRCSAWARDRHPENRASAKLADVFYDGVEIPFPAGAFDGVLCDQVLEHAIDPGALLREIGRVLATRGTLILSVPLLWPEHQQPNDNQRSPPSAWDMRSPRRASRCKSTCGWYRRARRYAPCSGPVKRLVQVMVATRPARGPGHGHRDREHRRLPALLPYSRPGRLRSSSTISSSPGSSKRRAPGDAREPSTCPLFRPRLPVARPDHVSLPAGDGNWYVFLHVLALDEFTAGAIGGPG